VRALAAAHEPLEIQRIFAGVRKLCRRARQGHEPKLVLEMGFLRLATRPKLEDVGVLLAPPRSAGRLRKREPERCAGTAERAVRALRRGSEAAVPTPSLSPPLSSPLLSGAPQGE